MAGIPNLTRRADGLRELMDSPAADPATLRRTYAAFRLLNPIVAGWDATYRRLLRPLLSRSEPRTLLDVGCGGGDVSRWLARRAAGDGLLLRVTGIDPDPRAFAYASAHSAPGVSFARAFAEEMRGPFDFVVSNHVLHHLDDLGGFLAETARLARVLTIHSDLARDGLAYAAFGVLSLPLAPGTFIRADGLTSIRRSYTAGELRAAAPEGWRVIQLNRARLLAVRAGGG